mmetsp:Transcript_7859/g.14630  ORF Transcript_7859/g.14630 Transcript_7859/m.14630 type:complete len:294 (+) Transcript_7859:53-934(+)
MCLRRGAGRVKHDPELGTSHGGLIQRLAHAPRVVVQQPSVQHDLQTAVHWAAGSVALVGHDAQLPRSVPHVAEGGHRVEVACHGNTFVGIPSSATGSSLAGHRIQTIRVRIEQALRRDVRGKAGRDFTTLWLRARVLNGNRAHCGLHLHESTVQRRQAMVQPCHLLDRLLLPTCALPAARVRPFSANLRHHAAPHHLHARGGAQVQWGTTPRPENVGPGLLLPRACQVGDVAQVALMQRHGGLLMAWPIETSDGGDHAIWCEIDPQVFIRNGNRAPAATFTLHRAWKMLLCCC